MLNPQCKFEPERYPTPSANPAWHKFAGPIIVLLTFFTLTANAQTQQAYLKASNTGTINDQFGFSVAVSGNTVAAGAPTEQSSATGINGKQDDNSADNAGAVYVFVQDGSDWSQQAYLKASNTDAYDLFGFGVAISGDTLAVGAPGEASLATGINNDQNDNSANEAGAVYIFVRNGSSWSQQAYIKASNTGAGDKFGLRVALSGDTLLVGAQFEDSNATGVNGDQSDNSAEDSGAVYVFTRNGTTWSQQAYLKASNTNEGDVFGRSVDISGETIVIGSAESSNATGVNGDQSNNDADYAGAAYVFTRSGNAWSQQAYLKASNTDRRDLFGHDVAISGDTVAVGAPLEASSATGIDGNQGDNSQINAGAAYVFVRNGNTWSQQAYVKAPNSERGDIFGRNLVLMDQTLVVSAEREDSAATGINGDQEDNSQSDSGAVYLYERAGEMWSMRSYIKASNTGEVDEFGWSMDLSNETLVIGVPEEDSGANVINGDQADNSVSSAGAAYVFVDTTPNTPFLINPGLNDAWYNPATDGQGVLISVLPDSGMVFLAWFTYDTELPPGDATAHIGDPGHRWLTAQGMYADNQAVMDVTITRGGKFDSPADLGRTDPPGSDGTLTLTFDDCYSGTIEYDIRSIARQGTIPIQRIANDNVVLCEALVQGTTPPQGAQEPIPFTVDDEMNAGLNDAWYNPATDGQGFLVSVLPESSIVFVAWFTYDTEDPPEDATANLGDPGHRWLTAQGTYTGGQAVTDLTVTSGGLFDYTSDISRTDPPGSDGTMTLTFDDCYTGTVEYQMPALGKQGTIPIQRIVNDNAPLCEMLMGQ
jgi:hypothetical protein